MNEHRFQPRLHKKLVLKHEEYTVYSVNALTVRNYAKPEEEFGNFATSGDFPKLIPKGEIWISEKLAAREGLFFIANSLVQLSRGKAGADEGRAYQDGLEAERLLRKQINGIEFRDGKPHRSIPAEIYLQKYADLPDGEGRVEVWLVDGNRVRSYYKTDYTEGGHGYVYPWVPQSQIWLEDGVDHRELHFIAVHEFIERKLMRDAHLSYDRAHLACATLEYDLRKNDPVKEFLVSGRKKLGKPDLQNLDSDDLFAHVRKHYVK
jgi:hypothetical protein